MRKSSFISPFALLCASIALLSGCATGKASSDRIEEFGATNVFAHTFAGTDKASCEAARRALLSQGYVISEAKASFIKGRRKFQPDIDVHIEIEFSVVCASDSKGSNSTTVFANAVRDRYSLKKSSNSASIGVGGIGSVSLPFGATDDSLVKVASETIPTGKFYARFFDLVERYFDDSSVADEENVEEKKTGTPTQTIFPAPPALPVAPALPVQPTLPVPPVLPVQPALPVPPVLPAQPTLPAPSVLPVQPALPVPPAQALPPTKQGATPA